MPQNNPVEIFHTSRPRVTIDTLNPCLSYWVVVTAIDCVSRVSSSPQLIGLFESVQSDFEVTVTSSADNMLVTWKSRNAIVQQQLQSVEVILMSECATGIMPPQTQVFNVTEGNLVTASRLGTLCIIIMHAVCIGHFGYIQ